MVWQSTTQVARVSAQQCDDMWTKVAKLGNLRELLGPPVCCAFVQGACTYGSSCRYVHDISRLRKMGCTYGSQCAVKHPIAGEGYVPGKAHEEGFCQGIMKDVANAPTGEARYLECRGEEYDDSDDLWDAATRAAIEKEECTGASDLPDAARKRLTVAGCYKLMDEDMVDEWLRMPGAALLDRLSGDTPVGFDELVKRAAGSGEHILVHHLVNWTGDDAEIVDPMAKKPKLDSQ